MGASIIGKRLLDRGPRCLVSREDLRLADVHGEADGDRALRDRLQRLVHNLGGTDEHPVVEVPARPPKTACDLVGETGALQCGEAEKSGARGSPCWTPTSEF